MSPAKGLLIQTIKGVTVVNFTKSAIMDAVEIEELAEQLYELVDMQNRKNLVLDFSEVRFLASQTLGVLINLQSKAAKLKGRIVICGMRKELFKVFKITCLDKVFQFCKNEEEALNSFGVYTTH